MTFTIDPQDLEAKNGQIIDGDAKVVRALFRACGISALGRIQTEAYREIEARNLPLADGRSAPDLSDVQVEVMLSEAREGDEDWYVLRRESVIREEART